MPGHDLRVLAPETGADVIDWNRKNVWGAADIRKASWEAEALSTWGTPIEQEIRLRIRLAVATYAYEIADKPIVSDAVWDQLAQRVRPKVGTCHPLIDEFFVTQFSPMTGMWIHNHPELPKIKKLFDNFYHGI